MQRLFLSVQNIKNIFRGCNDSVGKVCSSDLYEYKKAGVFLLLPLLYPDLFGPDSASLVSPPPPPFQKSFSPTAFKVHFHSTETLTLICSDSLRSLLVYSFNIYEHKQKGLQSLATNLFLGQDKGQSLACCDH